MVQHDFPVFRAFTGCKSLKIRHLKTVTETLSGQSGPLNCPGNQTFVTSVPCIHAGLNVFQFYLYTSLIQILFFAKTPTGMRV